MGERETLCFPSDTKDEATRADPAAAFPLPPQCFCLLGSSFPKVLQDTEIVSVYRHASIFKSK